MLWELLVCFGPQLGVCERLETRIFIKGDATAPYEIVAQVLGKVSSAGFKKFTMSSLPSDS